VRAQPVVHRRAVQGGRRYCALLYSCSTHTHTVLILYSYSTHTLLILYSYSTHVLLILFSYSTHTPPCSILLYATDTILYSYSTLYSTHILRYSTHILRYSLLVFSANLYSSGTDFSCMRVMDGAGTGGQGGSETEKTKYATLVVSVINRFIYS
jgi:hypothetical protein